MASSDEIHITYLLASFFPMLLPLSLSVSSASHYFMLWSSLLSAQHENKSTLCVIDKKDTSLTACLCICLSLCARFPHRFILFFIRQLNQQPGHLHPLHTVPLFIVCMSVVFCPSICLCSVKQLVRFSLPSDSRDVGGERKGGEVARGHTEGGGRGGKKHT